MRLCWWWWLSNTRPCTPWSSVKNKRFLLSFCHLPIKFHNFSWDLGSFAPSPSSSWCHRYPHPTFATTQLSLSMSLFYCSLVALYLLLPLDPFTLGLHHLRWPWLAVANGTFPISHVIDAGPFTIAPYPLPLNPCYFYVVRCLLNFEHFGFTLSIGVKVLLLLNHHRHGWDYVYYP